jgi:hypothetical protein
MLEAWVREVSPRLAHPDLQAIYSLLQAEQDRAPTPERRDALTALNRVFASGERGRLV